MENDPSDDTPSPANLPVPADQPEPPETRREKPYRVRHDGWTAERQNIFIESLAKTRCVRDASRMAGISWNSAYRHRRRSKAFADRWDLALRRSETTIGEVTWQRAVEGVEEDVWYHGKVVGQRTKYANDLLRLLYQHDTNGAARDAQGRFAPAGEEAGGTDAGAGPEIAAEQEALPAPEDEGPIPRPKGPITMDNLKEKFDAMAARSHEYGNRHINIKTGQGMTDEVVEGVQRFIARGRVELPKEFQWTRADDYDAKEAEFLALYPGGVPEGRKAEFNRE